MDEREHLTDQMSRLASELDRSLRRALPGDWPDVELTMPQLKTLAGLLDGPARMGDIAAQSGISLSAATAMIDRLVEKELVTRSHDRRDRRVVVCELTGAGRELVESFWRIREESLRKLALAMSVDELRVVTDALRIMALAAGRQAPSPNESHG